jgi:hypothetical protein
LALLAAGSIAVAQSKTVPASRLGVDLVKLKSGKTIRGAIVRYAADGSLTMAVPREWLRKTYPDVFAKLAEEEAPVRRQACEQLRNRLTQELATTPQDSHLATFLRIERKRVERLLSQTAPPEEPQFLWFDVQKNKIARVARATPERQRIAVWAWSEHLSRVESREADVLARELKRKDVDPALPPPDLSDRISPRLQDDREWTARIDVAAYALDERLDFQGTGDTLVRVDRSAGGKDMAPVVARLLGQQMDSLLKDLLGTGHAAAGNAAAPDEWLKPATLEAERRKARAFRATRVEFNLDGRQVLVASAFVVRLDNHAWETIWFDRETQDTTKPRPDMEAIISNDPQVKSALGAIKSLGAVTDDQFQQAIRFGAATMSAQQAVDSRFALFRDSLLKRLDGPPLWWTK